MSYVIPQQFNNASITCKANVYFEGKVTSHTIVLADGTRKSIGLVYSGAFKFNTDAPERMEIIAGKCRVRIADHKDWAEYEAGTYFDVPGKSSFEIEVEDGIAEYVCSFG